MQIAILAPLSKPACPFACNTNCGVEQGIPSTKVSVYYFNRERSHKLAGSAYILSSGPKYRQIVGSGTASYSICTGIGKL
jgi:hypothetical protein